MATCVLDSSIGQGGNNSNESNIDWKPLLTLLFALPLCTALEPHPELLLCVPFGLHKLLLWPRSVCVQL